MGPAERVITVLGIETSCDETAAAVVRSDGAVLSDVIESQVAAHAPYGGIVPELASRDHLRNVRPVIEAALARAGVGLGDLDWIEVNEAFACVPLAWARELGADIADVNPWGGAIAHGHPLGATGLGLVAKALAGLESTGGTLALVVFCAGHGMATATVLERL